MFVGALAEQADVRSYGDDQDRQLVRFRLKVPRIGFDGRKLGEDVVQLVAFSRWADAVVRQKPGTLLAVEARYQVREWETQDGTPRRSHEFVVDQLRVLSVGNGQAAPSSRRPVDGGNGDETGRPSPARSSSAKTTGKVKAPSKAARVNWEDDGGPEAVEGGDDEDPLGNF